MNTKQAAPNFKQAIRILIRNLLKCMLIGLGWSACLVVATLPLQALFGLGGMLWFFLYLGIGLTYFVCRKTGWKPTRWIDYPPAAFSLIWMSAAAFTIPLVKILGKTVYYALAPLGHFMRNFFGGA